MRNAFLATMSFFVCLALIATASYAAHAGEETSCDSTCTQMRQIFRQKSVVRVVALGEGGSSSGSGVVLPEGVLTNNHVIEGALKIYIEFYEVNGYHEVTVIGRDLVADLALLTMPLIPQGVTQIALGDNLNLGEQVYALGYPFGERVVTIGRVNSKSSIFWLYPWTQTPLAPGSSGGPLFNEQMKIVGINTAIVPVPGVLMSYTLPVEYMKRILSRLTRERVIRHGFIGFALYDAMRILPIFLDRMGLSYPPYEGIVAIGVPPNSPPDRAGIRSGDYIVKFNGTLVKTARDLEKRIFFDHRPDEEVEIELKRGSQTFVKKFLLSEYVSPLRRQKNQE